MRKTKMFVCLAAASVIAGGGTLADPQDRVPGSGVRVVSFDSFGLVLS